MSKKILFLSFCVGLNGWGMEKEENILKNNIKNFISNNAFNIAIKYSKEKKFLYFNIQKVASLTISKALRKVIAPQCDLYMTWSDDVLPFLNQNDIDIIIDEKIFKFVFVRNPYNRILSCYLMIKNQWGDFFNKLDIKNFRDFLTTIKNQSPCEMDMHWRPQFIHAIQPLVKMDFIGRFENLEQDLNYVLKKIDNTEQKIEAVDHHATHASEHLSEYYDEECVSLVQKIYQKDFEIFGYDMKPHFELKKTEN